MKLHVTQAQGMFGRVLSRSSSWVVSVMLTEQCGCGRLHPRCSEVVCEQEEDRGFVGPYTGFVASWLRAGVAEEGQGTAADYGAQGPPSTGWAALACIQSLGRVAYFGVDCISECSCL